MFGRKKEDKRRGNTRNGLSQFGLLDLPNVNDFGSGMMGGMDDEDDDDDSTLEAELLALTSGKSPTKPKRVRPAPVNLDAMIAASMKDIPSDEELSGDENDPDLLDELSALNEDEEEEKVPEVKPETRPPDTGLSLVVTLEERLKMYEEAETNAKTAGESSRAKRFNRGIKTLADLLKQARAGRVINEEDIPPPVVTTAGKKPVTPISPSPEEIPSPVPDNEGPAIPPRPPPRANLQPALLPTVPSRPAPPPPIEVPSVDPTSNTESSSEFSEEKMNILNELKERQNQYKRAAVQAKRTGDNDTAIRYVRIAKQFDPVIKAVIEDQPVDLSAMPPQPSEFVISTSQPIEQKEEGEKQGTSEEIPPAPSEESEVDLYGAPPAPATVMEALEQRLKKYQSSEQAAREEGNSSKARRMGRIVKQYESAIKLHRAGKPIPVEDLPTPPGFAPIPVEGGSAPVKTPSEDPVVSIPPTVPQPQPKTAPPQPKTAPPPPPPAPATTSQAPQKMNVRKVPQSRQEKQLAFLVARQKEFKDAALQAKKNGEINQAREYLKLAKGFDPLIEASNSGLPVDMDTVPVPPDTKVMLESDFDFVTVDDCIPGSDAEIFDKLEEDLLKQAKMCLSTRDHFKSIGDVASANRFEQMALHSKKDLDAVRCAHKRSEAIPKFHYEPRSFSIVQCCTDLGDNDLQLIIVQGINYTVPNPKEVDTYVKFEFPYPSEDPPKDRTSLIKDTNNPEYNATFNLTIHRNSRACQRVFKRHGIKLEVWSRGGFFRSDSLIGTAIIKLQPLETKCTIHDSFDLLDGKKPVGGKLEVKVRVRNPIVTKQIEKIQEKWLVIDQFQ